MKKTFFLLMTVIIVSFVMSSNNRVYSYVPPFTPSDSALIKKLIEYAQHFEEVDNKKESAGFYNKVAFLYWKYDNLKEAEAYYLRSLTNYKIIDDKPGMSSVYLNLALIYSDLNNFTESLNNFNKAITINESLNNKTALINNYKDLGIMHFKQKKYDTAITVYFKSLNLANALKDRVNANECYGLIAEAYKQKGDMDKSTFYYSQYNPSDVTSSFTTDEYADNQTNKTPNNTGVNSHNSTINSNTSVSNTDDYTAYDNQVNNNSNSENSNNLDSDTENNLPENINNSNELNNTLPENGDVSENTVTENLNNTEDEFANPDQTVNKDDTQTKLNNSSRFLNYYRENKGVIRVSSVLLLLLVGAVLVLRISSKRNKNTIRSATSKPIKNFSGEKTGANIEVQKTKIENKQVEEPVKIITSDFATREKQLQNLMPKSFLAFSGTTLSSSLFHVFEIKDNIGIVMAQNSGKNISELSMNSIKSFFEKEQEIKPENILKNFERYIKSNKIADADYSMGICMINKVSKKISFSGADSRLIVMQNNLPKTLSGGKNSISGNNSNKYKSTSIGHGAGHRYYMFNKSFESQLGQDSKNRNTEDVLKSIYRKSISEQKNILNAKINKSGAGDALIVGFAL